MELLKIGIIGLITFSAFTACNNEHEWPDELTPPGQAEETAQLIIRLNTQTDSMTDELPGESSIHSVHLYIYDENGNNLPEEPYIYLKGEGPVYITEMIPGKKKIVAMVNTGLPNEVTTRDLTALSQLLMSRTINPTGSAEAATIFHSWYGIPMHSDPQDITLEKGEKKTIVIPVNRILSRINAPKADNALVDLPDYELERLKTESGIAFADDMDFRLTGHIMINGGGRYCIFPNYGVTDLFERWTRWSIGTYITTTYNNDGSLKKAYSGTQFLTGDQYVYAFENTAEYKNGVYNKNKMYAFILRGEFFDGEGNTATRYWRVNIAQKAFHNGRQIAPYQILRNAIYNVNITDVRTAGYNTPKEAEEGAGAVLESQAEIIQWQTHETVTDL